MATKLCRYYTQYCNLCHMVFYVIVVTFLMTLLIVKCTNVVLDYG